MELLARPCLVPLSSVYLSSLVLSSVFIRGLPLFLAITCTQKSSRREMTIVQPQPTHTVAKINKMAQQLMANLRLEDRSRKTPRVVENYSLSPGWLALQSKNKIHAHVCKSVELKVKYIFMTFTNARIRNVANCDSICLRINSQSNCVTFGTSTSDPLLA